MDHHGLPVVNTPDRSSVSFMKATIQRKIVFKIKFCTRRYTSENFFWKHHEILIFRPCTSRKLNVSRHSFYLIHAHVSGMNNKVTIAPHHMGCGISAQGQHCGAGRSLARRLFSCPRLCTHLQLTADSAVSTESVVYAPRRRRSRCVLEPTARPPRNENEAPLLA